MTRQNRWIPGIAAAALVAALGAVHLRADVARINPAALLEHIKYLASDELEGRGNGSLGLQKAGEYITGQFQAAGLAPGGDNGTFY